MAQLFHHYGLGPGPAALGYRLGRHDLYELHVGLFRPQRRGRHHPIDRRLGSLERDARWNHIRKSGACSRRICRVGQYRRRCGRIHCTVGMVGINRDSEVRPADLFAHGDFYHGQPRRRCYANIMSMGSPDPWIKSNIMPHLIPEIGSVFGPFGTSQHSGYYKGIIDEVSLEKNPPKEEPIGEVR